MSDALQVRLNHPVLKWHGTVLGWATGHHAGKLNCRTIPKDTDGDWSEVVTWYPRDLEEVSE